MLVIIIIIGPPLLAEGTYKFMPVRSFVRSLVTHFSRNWLVIFFLIFCMKLGDHKYSKVTKPDFSGKISFPSFGPKRGKKRVF